MPEDLSGKVALVTGGGRGIGRAIATELAAGGAAVAVVARTDAEVTKVADELNASGGKAIALTCDVTDRTAVERTVSEVERQLGPIDVLVNDAGRAGAGGRTWELDPENWWRDVEVNILGTLLPTRTVLPGMIERKRGWIVNVASGNAIRPAPFISAYASSKAAVVRFTDCLAAELEGLGVVVFALSPGIVRTQMTEALAASEQLTKWQPRFRNVIDSGETFPPERAARLAAFMVSGRADALTGRMLRITDDYESLAANAADIVARDLYAMRRTELPAGGV